MTETDVSRHSLHISSFIWMGRRCAQPKDYLSRLPFARKKWAWDPGLVNNELVGTARLPKKLFLKWADLAGICLCPSSPGPSCLEHGHNACRNTNHPMTKEMKANALGSVGRREKPGFSVMSLQSCTSPGLPVSKLLDMQEK